MVWWIASRADGEQYKGRTASQEVFLWWWFAWEGFLPPTVVASPIYRARPWDSSQIMSGKGANN